MINQPNRRSIRLKGYDYSQEGLYFLTMCCQDRMCRFGRVVNGQMELNEMGKIAEACWLEIPKHFANVILHDFIIMPNHIHGIIEIVGAKDISPEELPEVNRLKDISPEELPEINRSKDISPEELPEVNRSKDISPEELPEVNRSKDISPEEMPKVNRSKDISPQHGTSKTIGSIVRGFKIGVTKWVRRNTEVQDLWQRNYYEHIIRNKREYHNISQYIQNNPSKWNEDKFYR